MAQHRKRTASARRAHSADLHALERHQAGVERAAWVASQVEPSAGDPPPGLEPRGGGNKRSMTDAPPSSLKGGRIDPGSILAEEERLARTADHELALLGHEETETAADRRRWREEAAARTNLRVAKAEAARAKEQA